MTVTPCYWLGQRDYVDVWHAMEAFTDQRDENAPGQIWFLEHPPVFTQGQAGKEEHILAPGDIPLVASDRGGQVTYHGPGQLVVYPLLNLKHLGNGKGMGIRSLVEALEKSIINCLTNYGITAYGKRDAPGVYVDAKKIASIGLRVRRHCCYHGISLNVDMDLEPFSRINPCGYQGLNMTQISELSDSSTNGAADMKTVASDLRKSLGPALGINLSEIKKADHENPLDEIVSATDIREAGRT